LLELVHQLRLVLQAAGGVDQHEVAVFRSAPSRRLRRQDPQQSAPVRLGNEAPRPARSPQTLQLLDGRRAEGVAGRQQTFAPCADSLAAILPMVVVLPEPLTPTNSTMRGRGPVAEIDDLLARLQDRGDLRWRARP
jgi:hypothetical protein